MILMKAIEDVYLRWPPNFSILVVGQATCANRLNMGALAHYSIKYNQLFSPS